MQDRKVTPDMVPVIKRARNRMVTQIALDPPPDTSARRGRGPSPAKTAQTRRAIIAAGLDVFLERGFSASRMIDVAARAGFAKGTLYLYFTDKEALFEGVLGEVVAPRPPALVEATAPEHESMRSFIERTLLPLIRDFEESRRADVLRLIVAEGARFPSLGDSYRRVVLDPIMTMIAHRARLAAARGELGSDALIRFPFLLGAPGVLATIWNGLYGATEPVDTAAVFEAFLDLTFGPKPAHSEA